MGGESPAPLDVVALRGRLGASVTAAITYAALAEIGLEYGPAFQGLVELWSGEGEALGRVRLPEAAGSVRGYRIHPALLDACFQVMGGVLAAGGEGVPWVPVEVGSLRLYQRPLGELWCHARSVSGQETSDRRRVDLGVVDSTGAWVAEISGLVVQRLASGARGHEEDEWFLDLEWEPAAVASARVKVGRFVLLGEGGGLGVSLRAALEAAGHGVVQATGKGTGAAGVRTLLANAFGGESPTAVVHLGSLDAGRGLDAEGLEAALVYGCDSVLDMVQALAGLGFRDAPRLWVVTRGAQSVGSGEVAVGQAPVLGLSRVIALEHAELRCIRIDLDPARPAGEVDALLGELLADDAEEEVALRGGERRVARLVRRLPEAERRERLESVGARAFRLEIDQPGVLDHLVLRATERRAPGPGEVEIAVEAAGLNFLDVMKAMGIYPGPGDGPVALGGECAGRVVAVGEGVDNVGVGQQVVAVAPFCFGSHVTVDARMVALRPGTLTAAQAAALPVVFMTAWYGLVHLARLRAGERVLIHSATGGTGLAAVQIARHLGAEIFATAGTPEKRAWLREQGIARVMDSRSLDFAQQVLAATKAEGVDVVLNSLAGAAIEASLATLGADGRFIELGKTDIYAERPLSLSHFRKSLSYSAVDLAGLAQRRPERFAALLAEVVALHARGVLGPLPVETVPVLEGHRGIPEDGAGSAYRQAGAHTGGRGGSHPRSGGIRRRHPCGRDLPGDRGARGAGSECRGMAGRARGGASGAGGSRGGGERGAAGGGRGARGSGRARHGGESGCCRSGAGRAGAARDRRVGDAAARHRARGGGAGRRSADGADPGAVAHGDGPQGLGGHAPARADARDAAGLLSCCMRRPRGCWARRARGPTRRPTRSLTRWRTIDGRKASRG